MFGGSDGCKLHQFRQDLYNVQRNHPTHPNTVRRHTNLHHARATLLCVCPEYCECTVSENQFFLLAVHCKLHGHLMLLKAVEFSLYVFL